MSADVEHPKPDFGDPTRRTWLAAERTWLAWWRTALGAAAVAIGVGRVLPDIVHSARWPFTLLGIGYAVLAIAVLLAGAVRQERTAQALRRGSYSEMSTALVLWLTAGALVLAVGSLVLIAVKL
jgi:putative membrane protein